MKWKKITLRNCQSIKKAQYELIDGLNVIEAPSETGKSIYIKMLRLLCNWNTISKEERLSCIRGNSNTHQAENYASMQIHLDNNKSLIFFIYIQDILEWRMLNEDGSTIEQGFGEAPYYVREFIGIRKIESFNRVISIIDNEDKIAYDSTDPIQNSELVKMYTTHTELNNRLHNTEEAMRELQTKKMYVNKQINILNEDLKNNYGYINLNHITDLMNSSQELSERLYVIESILDICKPLENKKIPKVIEVDEYSDLFNNLNKLKSLLLAILPVKNLANKVPEILSDNDIEDLTKLFNNLIIQRDLIIQIENLKTSIENLNNLKIITDIPELPKKELIDLILNLANLIFYISSYEKINLIDEEEFNNMLTKLYAEKRLLTNLNYLRMKLKYLENTGYTENNLEYIYSEYIKNTPLCPLCKQPLQKEIGGCC